MSSAPDLNAGTHFKSETDNRGIYMPIRDDLKDQPVLTDIHHMVEGVGQRPVAKYDWLAP